MDPSIKNSALIAVQREPAEKLLGYFSRIRSLTNFSLDQLAKRPFWTRKIYQKMNKAMNTAEV